MQAGGSGSDRLCDKCHEIKCKCLQTTQQAVGITKSGALSVQRCPTRDMQELCSRRMRSPVIVTSQVPHYPPVPR